ncbi:HAD-IIA family hydrolase [Bacillus sp. XF8]|uniref:Acid sugar phosphatase n=1 Tax=Bacillus bingmayongensis TaxID=1150157 RepID=A0ABU5JTX0_9BACI|nr:HAD-IIA family hydrolase [Bacillus sp. XF8]MBO1581785.1 HAD-IIA family hydrolase [Bacillus sp. XF8]MDZ5606887.1 HAD-IIA family hydrolase [Bacillus pseudomycoides]
MRNPLNLQAYLFDLDGTIYLEDQLLPGVIEIISYVRAQNKKLMFITNTSIKTRVCIQKSLANLGLQVDLSEIMTAAFLAAQYFYETNRDANVFVVGSEHVFQELKTFHIRVTNNPLEATHVLVGLDKTFSYKKLHECMQAIQSGAQLVEINPDSFCPIQGDRIPDTGSLVKAIEVATDTKATVTIGKPSYYYIHKVMLSLCLQPEECLVIGDRLDTDILFGKQANMRTALVLTGVTSYEMAMKSVLKADIIVGTVQELHKQLHLDVRKKV